MLCGRELVQLLRHTWPRIVGQLACMHPLNGREASDSQLLREGFGWFGDGTTGGSYARGDWTAGLTCARPGARSELTAATRTPIDLSIWAAFLYSGTILMQWPHHGA